MPASIFDSAIYRGLFGDAEVEALFSDSAVVRAMLLVEGALAEVQGELGLIPLDSALFITRASREVQIDPSGFARETAVNGVPVPALVAAFRKAMEAPEHAQYIHWGATSQDIMDTGLALRLRRAVAIIDARLGSLIGRLGALAADHADLPMAARTYGQFATPTSFGAVIASWGRPVMRHRARIAAADVAVVSLGGAAGTLSAMEGQGPAVRAGLAARLGLSDPGVSWHTERDGQGALMDALVGLLVSLGKMGEDLILLTQSGVDEVVLAGAGGSSTMPQKQNPVGPSVLVALARYSVAVGGAFQGAGLHRQQRDGAAWFTEWMVLPQIVIAAARALALAEDLARGLRPDAAAMARNMLSGGGLIAAESYSFALARQMPRPAAQAKVKALCAEVVQSGVPLADLMARDFPGLQADLGLGEAPAEARAFADEAHG